MDEKGYDWIHAQELALTELLTLCFSVKESRFKALYPQVGRYFDFLDAARGTFRLELLTRLSPHHPAGLSFDGSYRLRDRGVITFC